MNVFAWCEVKGAFTVFTRNGCRHCRDRRRKDHQKNRRDHWRKMRALKAAEARNGPVDTGCARRIAGSEAAPPASPTPHHGLSRRQRNG